MTECKNCGREVVFYQAPDGLDPELSYWSHPEGQTMWCYLDRIEYEELPLSERDHKAAPAEVTA